jgi:hypothetical protein
MATGGTTNWLCIGDFRILGVSKRSERILRGWICNEFSPRRRERRTSLSNGWFRSFCGGKFKQFLDVVKTREKHGYESYFEAAMGMPVAKVIPLWNEYLNRIAVRRAEISRLPLSAILPNEEAFNKFTTSSGIAVARQ